MPSKWLRIICVILAFGWASTFVWYHEHDLRLRQDERLQTAIFHAQNEVLELHAKQINKLAVLYTKRMEAVRNETGV